MTTIRPCCGTPDDSRAPSPHARDCRAVPAPAGSGGPWPLRPTATIEPDAAVLALAERHRMMRLSFGGRS